MSKSQSKFKGAGLAFNEFGEFNKHLDDQEMIKYFQKILDGKISIPQKRPRPKKIIVDKLAANENASDTYSAMSVNKLNVLLGFE